MSEFSPRSLAIAAGYEVGDQPLPCGQRVCRPLEPGCVEQGTDLRQAERACSLVMSLQRLAVMHQDSQTLVDKLSVERRTGLLTYNALQTLFESKATELAELASRGYVMLVMYGDINQLKQQNDMGDHAGGDVVLGVAGSALQSVSRRSGELAGIIRHVAALDDMASESGEPDREEDFASRYEQGDELVRIAILPPNFRRLSREDQPQSESQQQLTNQEVLQREVDLIYGAFAGLYAEYPLINTFDAEAHAAKHVVVGTVPYEVIDETRRLVRVKVSMTFTVALAPLATSLEELEEIIRSTDEKMSQLKKRYKPIITNHGASLDLLPDVVGQE